VIHSILHLGLHVFVPGFIARAFFRPRWMRAWLVMVLTMLVDVDHLLADPVFDPNRCSIGFHPLHTAPAMVVYVGLTLIRPTRLVGLGLVIHMVLDGVDCLLIQT
jgi:hypothetical protein